MKIFVITFSLLLGSCSLSEKKKAVDNESHKNIADSNISANVSESNKDENVDQAEKKEISKKLPLMSPALKAIIDNPQNDSNILSLAILMKYEVLSPPDPTVNSDFSKEMITSLDENFSTLQRTFKDLPQEISETIQQNRDTGNVFFKIEIKSSDLKSKLDMLGHSVNSLDIWTEITPG